jgi:hypothetical protein
MNFFRTHGNQPAGIIQTAHPEIDEFDSHLSHFSFKPVYSVAS